MKYENLEAATALCARIKELNKVRESIDASQGPLCVSISKRWDGRLSIIKDWSDTLYNKDDESGMFYGEMLHFIHSCERNVEQRIQRLTEELDKL